MYVYKCPTSICYSTPNPSEYAGMLRKHAEKELKEADFIKSKLEQIADSKLIKSVMVGTFYDGPAHIGGRDNSKPPYVKIGSEITPETVVYCVEAMLVFNEIKAGVYGTIEEKLVKSGQPVNYEQALFKIIPKVNPLPAGMMSEPELGPDLNM